MEKKSLSYKDAGVDINAGNDLVERIKEDVKRTRRPEVMGGLVVLVRCVLFRVNTKSRFWSPALTVSALSCVWRLI